MSDYWIEGAEGALQDKQKDERIAKLEEALRESREEIERLKHPILVIRDSLVEDAQIEIQSLQHQLEILKKPSRRIVITCAGNVDIMMEKE